ncbi:MAG: alpha/beta fold hydrolase [Pirellulales bacterium]|nr:alpha/beta fold hydrolase [Pirellulales bacterium]
MSTGGFKAAWWLRGGHGQTLWASLLRRIPLKARSERLETPDGDFIRLDWVGSNGPIVVVLPGLQGDMSSSQVRGLLRACGRRGWRSVLLNYRGRGEPNRLPHSYHCGRTCDLDYLVRVLREREPNTPIGTVGYSVGANICLKWLGESGRRGENLPVAAAVGVSAPFDLGAVAKKIEKGFSRIYQWHLLKSIRRDLERKMEAVNVGLELTRRELRSLSTFFQFDDRVTGPLNGFDGAEDYYAKTRCDTLLRYVSVPTLIVNARNDPLVPACLIPDAQSVSGHVTLEISESGGHMGFISGRWPWAPRFWLDTRVPEFLARFF